MSEFLEQLDEAFSNVTFVDVTELRNLYYGRQNIFVSFSDNGEHFTSGVIKGDLTHPSGVISHSIDAVVGKKVGTSYFYANVFRFRGSSSDILNVNSYSADHYKEDLIALEFVSQVDFDDVSDAKAKVNANPRLRSYFERIWALTKEISSKKSNPDVFWANMLMELGYDSVIDDTGKGLIMRDRVPIHLILNTSKMLDLDIVPIQKYRKDRRMNVVRRINKKNKRFWLTRNRIAKRKTDKYRDDSPSDSWMDSVAEFRRLVLGI